MDQSRLDESTLQEIESFVKLSREAVAKLNIGQVVRIDGYICVLVEPPADYAHLGSHYKMGLVLYDDLSSPSQDIYNGLARHVPGALVTFTQWSGLDIEVLDQYSLPEFTEPK